jgi:predicted transcriptional regulator
MKQIKIHVESDADFFDRARNIARKGDKSGHIAAENHLSFGALDVLLRALTQRRWALLKTLRKLGPRSIRSLATHLRRDYKAVHVDVTALIEFGLIERNEAGLVSVPWTRISADVELAAA